MRKYLLLSLLLIAIEVRAQQQSSVNSTSQTLSTSTADIPKPEKPKVGFLVLSVAEVGAADFRDRNSNAAVSTTNGVGLTYKTSETEKWGVRQYFTYLRDVDAGSKFERSSTILTYSKKFSGIFGSDDVNPLLWYYLPTTDKAIAENSNGKFRLTTYVTWTLNPKWGVTYFFDPRQSLTPDSIALDGKESFSHTTWIHGLSLSYTLSDQLSFYYGCGSTEDWRTSRMTLLDETFDLSAGMYITLGPVLLMPDITNSVATREGGARPESRSVHSTFYRAEQTTYSVSMIANF